MASLRLGEHLAQCYGSVRPFPARREEPQVLPTVSKGIRSWFKCILQTFNRGEVHEFEEMLCCGKDKVCWSDSKRSAVFNQKS